jgi:hypothetical protein
VATSPKDGSSKSRKTLSEAISTLKTALTGFTTMQAYAKAKDVVYLMVISVVILAILNKQSSFLKIFLLIKKYSLHF